jgi:hypothetical protein
VALHTGAVGLALQALDGTKIQACASGHTGWTKEYMEKLLAALDQALDQTELKVAGENADLDPPGLRLPAGLAERKALRQQIQSGLAQLAADGRSHHHPVELEARRMKVEGRNRHAYNAQAIADEKEGVIIACEATRQETDTGQLVPMMEQARENLGPAAGAAPITTVADTGYGAGADLQAAAQNQMTVLVPPAESGADHAWATRHFHYDDRARTLTCPRGEVLDHEGHTTRYGVRVERYRCHCRDCPVRGQCTRDPKGRQVEVWPHTPEVQAMRARLREPGPRRQWQRRREIIERCFGQIKQHDGFRRWTVWGLENVRTQWSVLCATLNLRILWRRWRGGRSDGPRSAAGVPAGGLRLQVAALMGWVEKWRQGLEPVSAAVLIFRRRPPPVHLKYF